jgi:hypothetical protein
MDLAAGAAHTGEHSDESQERRIDERVASEL